ncbi:MAG: cysteine hydrolase [Beijerinckiaceae bacterium]|nr:cysteine hydrolase [Beijerinckiaceae bacterium]
MNASSDLPKTLLQMSGADLAPPSLADAALVLVDLQNEYLSGPLRLPDAEAAVDAASILLTQARANGATIIHIAHKGAAGGAFDRSAKRGAIIDAVEPLPGETVIEKGLPNAFAATALDETLKTMGRKQLILAGFMTHMCISSTARAALDLNYRVTIDANACATRDLPDGRGGLIRAAALHEASLIALSDRFAIVVRGHDWTA